MTRKHEIWALLLWAIVLPSPLPGQVSKSTAIPPSRKTAEQRQDAANSTAKEAGSRLVPQQLQGRKSYWIQDQSFLSKSQISARLARPRSVQEFTRNLYIVWKDKLLVEPAFYDDLILMTCFDGTSLTWKDMLVDPTGDDSNRVAELQLDSRLFPQTVVRVRLYRHKVLPTKKPQPYFPSHQHYIGFLEFSVKGSKDFTWEDVTHVFGKNAVSLSPRSIDDPGREPSGVVALMRYSYPGDDPTKFGDLELPQTKISLSGWRPDGPLSQREGPRGSDNVTRVFMLEAINSMQGEE